MGHSGYTVVTDHNPLKGIFQKDLTEIDNRRLQRFRERLQPYAFNLVWHPGKTHLIADAFSRQPVSKPRPEDNAETDERPILRQLKTSQDLQTSLETAAKEDEAYQQLYQAVQSHRHPKSLPSDHPARRFSSVWSQLSTDDNFVIYDSYRIVIPKIVQKDIVVNLHKSHSGFVKTKKLAQSLYYWPTMTAEIKTSVEACDACAQLAPSQPKEPIKNSTASYPMDLVGMDLFQSGSSHYLVMVDRFSGFPFVAHLRSLTTSAVVKVLLSWFQDFGFPATIRSDGGPQFRTEFEDFCAKHCIKKETSSAYYPQSNGLAENAVKQMKRLLVKVNGNFASFKDALLQWRNTPREDGYSPAQLFFGHRQNFGLPAHRRPQLIDRALVHENRLRQEQHAGNCFDQRAHKLRPLKPKQRVWVQNPSTQRWNKKATVEKVRANGKSYLVAFDDGSTSLRNRRFLRPDSAHSGAV